MQTIGKITPTTDALGRQRLTMYIYRMEIMPDLHTFNDCGSTP